MQRKACNLKRIDQLCQTFPDCLAVFNKGHFFSGPSVYFHQKAIAARRKHARASDAIDDPALIETIYATLTAWGMHRMGPGNARLVDFQRLFASFQQVKPLILNLEDLRLECISPADVPDVGRELWNIIRQLEVGVGKVKLVSGSKALHHILPDLVPPIDREYTLTFFYGNKNIRADGLREFSEIFPCFHNIAVQNLAEIQSELACQGEMNTSVTKVIDNAIVGYVIGNIKGKNPKSHPIITSPANGTAREVQKVERVEKMLITDQILWAVGALIRRGEETFTREEIRQVLQIERVRWNNSFSPLIQKMRVDQPGVPSVPMRYRNVFERVDAGKYRLTDAGQQLLSQLGFQGGHIDAR